MRTRASPVESIETGVHVPKENTLVHGRVSLHSIPRRIALSPEECLQRAIGAQTPRARGIWARRGLSCRGRLDREVQSMLLRQLYLCYYESKQFRRAVEISEQLVDIGVMPDVAHQDAARAKAALGDIDSAAGHLRLAARLGPASRKAFHWWTLGSLYFVKHRYEEAIGALVRASRWGTTDRPLYQAHLAVVQRSLGHPVDELPILIQRLSEAPSGQGYGRFILGCLAYYNNDTQKAKRYLESFVQRTLAGRLAMSIALEGELMIAKQFLEEMGLRKLKQ